MEDQLHVEISEIVVKRLELVRYGMYVIERRCQCSQTQRENWHFDSLLQGKAQWVKYAVMNHFVSLVLAVLAMVGLSIFYGQPLYFLVGVVVIGERFVVLSIAYM